MEQAESHPGVAAVLSFIFNGLGQIYNGQIKKGLVIIFFSGLSLFVFIIGAVLIGFWFYGKIVSCWQIIAGVLLFCFGLIVICALGIWSIFDAYNTAKKQVVVGK